jgi:ribosomal-protein-alanine N-acetyltransferase
VIAVPADAAPGFWARLAVLQAAAYAGGAAAPYDAEALRALACAAGGALVADCAARPAAFALGRAAADEGEVLALAVDLARRRAGLGGAALAALEARLAALGARRLFLEAADGNAAALALYRRAGWREAGRRPAYYPGRSPGGAAADALILVKPT